jgi:hypothetical protein
VTAEWRALEDAATVLLLDEAGVVREVIRADASVLKRFLTTLDGLAGRGEGVSPGDTRARESWGSLVMARGDAGEVLSIDPELFWDGIYRWFRSRGVDYDT